MDKLIEKIQNSKALLFDLDGVLTDTMPYHCSSWIQAFQEKCGFVLDPMEIYLREGEKGEKSVKEILFRSGIPFSDQLVSEIIHAKAFYFQKSIKHPVFFDGVRDLIQELSSIKNLALVTGTPLTEVKNMLPDSFLAYFKVIVTGSDVIEGKPHPEPYQKALDRLSILPQEALVFENAPLGIESAKGAGIEVCAIATSLPPEKLDEADYLCENYSIWISLMSQFLEFVPS
jgi:beta-phosphoglucomutase